MTRVVVLFVLRPVLELLAFLSFSSGTKIQKIYSIADFFAEIETPSVGTSPGALSTK